MAYNNYFPQYYPNMMQNQSQMPPQAPQMNQNASQSSGNGIIWVQGEAAAKAYPVAPGQSVLLMDSEANTLYIKSVDQSGMPLPLRILDFTERTSPHSESVVAKNATVEYISRSEFDEFKEDVKRSIKGLRKSRNEEEGNG